MQPKCDCFKFFTTPWVRSFPHSQCLSLGNLVSLSKFSKLSFHQKTSGSFQEGHFCPRAPAPLSISFPSQVVNPELSDVWPTQILAELTLNPGLDWTSPLKSSLTCPFEPKIASASTIGPTENDVMSDCASDYLWTEMKCKLTSHVRTVFKALSVLSVVFVVFKSMMNVLFISIVRMKEFPLVRDNALFRFKGRASVCILSVFCETWQDRAYDYERLFLVEFFRGCQGLLLSLIDMVIDVCVYGFQQSVWLTLPSESSQRSHTLILSDFKTLKCVYIYIQYHSIHLSSQTLANFLPYVLGHLRSLY